MPDMYDVSALRYRAASCVGAVDKCNLLDGQKIAEGNVLIGLASSSGVPFQRLLPDPQGCCSRTAKLDLNMSAMTRLHGKTLGEDAAHPDTRSM